MWKKGLLITFYSRQGGSKKVQDNTLNNATFSFSARMKCLIAVPSAHPFTSKC